MSSLEEAIEYIRMGNHAEGRQILEGLLEVEENDPDIWLWLSAAVDTDEDREICLENVLALDPGNPVAQQGLESLHAGNFNITELLGAKFEEEPEEEGPVTFLDDFVIEEDDDFDAEEELDFGPISKKSKGISRRQILIIVVLVVVMLAVMGGLGVVAYTRLAGGSVVPIDSTPGQGTPAEGGQPAVEDTPTPADTPTPVPTNTPTLTPTPNLLLPTPKPSDEPTPTATRVVSPTPVQ